MKKALIIGGGFAGCASAHQLQMLQDWDITLVEAAPFLGGGCKTQWHGGHPYTFGPRHFLTQNEKVYEYLNSIVPLRLCSEHQFLTYIEKDQDFYNFPIHRDDVPRMPEHQQIEKELAHISLQDQKKVQNLEEYWIASVGNTLYNKFIKRYTEKMWLVENNRVFDEFLWSAKGVAIKEGERSAWDKAISAYPIALDGYDQYFITATAGVNVLLKTRIERFDIPNKKVFFNGEWNQYDVIVNTISPDLLFEQCYGELPYIGRDFYKFVLPIEYAFPKDVYFLYYASEEPYTRLTEFKKFTQHSAPTTLIGMEIPSENGRYYPLPIKSEQEKAQKYCNLMPDDVFSIGRAGSYKYLVDIDDSIEQAMDIASMLQSGSRQSKSFHYVRQRQPK